MLDTIQTVSICNVIAQAESTYKMSDPVSSSTEQKTAAGVGQPVDAAPQKDSAVEGASSRRASKSAALMNMRGKDVSTEEIESNLADAKARARTAKSAEGAAAAGPASPKDKRLEMMAKLRTLLVKTPADENGLVDGTPFTQAGVTRMMTMLGKRSGDAAGGKLAASMVKFLSPETDQDATVAGASVKKLQVLAKRTEALKDQMQKRRNSP